VTVAMTDICATVTKLSARTENVEHKLYMANSPPLLFHDLHSKIIKGCGTLRPNRKAMAKRFGQKMKVKQGDIKTKVRGSFRTLVWKNNQNVNILWCV
jgi:hypothetical protein